MISPTTIPTTAAGELRSGRAPELMLQAGHRAEREPSEDPADHVADAGSQEDVQERSRPLGLESGRTELEPPGGEQGDEDQADALDQAPLQRALATLRRGLAHPLGSFPIAYRGRSALPL